MISALKKVSRSPVFSIGCLGKDPVKLSHPFCQIAVGGLDHQVEMVIHQAVCVTNPVASSDYFPQDFKESLAVLVIFIDTFLTVSTDRDVVQGTWKFDPEGACHGKCIANKYGDYNSRPDPMMCVGLFDAEGLDEFQEVFGLEAEELCGGCSR